MKVLLINLILTIFLAISSSYAVAKENQISSQFKKCLDKANTDFAMRECARIELYRVDLILNQTWKKLQTKMQSSDFELEENKKIYKNSLLTFQREWIKYVDEKCEFESIFEAGTGSMSRLIFMDCKINQIIIRTQELNSYIKHIDK